MGSEERFTKNMSNIKPELMYHLFLVFCLVLACISISAGGDPVTGPSVDFSHGRLKVSDNKRFIIHEDGTPFFYLGDTAWELFHRLNREEADKYLENRETAPLTVLKKQYYNT